jgi:hypothetical protein
MKNDAIRSHSTPLKVPRVQDTTNRILPIYSRDISKSTITIHKNNHPVIHHLRYRQSTIKSFLVPKPLTPLDQTISLLSTPSPPQKQPTKAGLRFPPHNLIPIQLQFSPSPLTTSETCGTVTIPLPNLTQRQLKITKFFQTRPKYTAPPPTIPIKIQTRQPQNYTTTRNAICQKLLSYHLQSPTSNNSQRRLSQPIPNYNLLDSWGHSLPIIDCSKVFCILLQNPNGISLTYNAISLRQDLQTCKDYGAAVISLPETNVNWNRPDQYATFTSTIRRIWAHSAVAVSRSPEDFPSQFQPGGTSTIICDNWVS